jgi:hypothetical protein
MNDNLQYASEKTLLNHYLTNIIQLESRERGQNSMRINQY